MGHSHDPNDVKIADLSRFALPFHELLWPPVCFACGDRRREACLCERCTSRLRRAPHPADPSLTGGLRLPIALWEFDDDAPIRAVLHRLKYQNSPWIGRQLGKDLGMSDLPQLDEPWDCIVPIPLHRSRLLERGYNQSEWIARGLADVLRVEVLVDGLVRVRDTRTQTSLARSLRRSNVLNAFQPSSASDLCDRRILLVDDTLTTGATLASAARALTDAGVQCVQPIAVARAALRLEQEQGRPASVIDSRTNPLADASPFFGHHL